MKSTTTKKVVFLCLINGILWVWSSYILAFYGRPEIAEDLSKLAITEIVAIVLIYCLKSLFENLAKNNDWLDKTDAISSNKKKNTRRDAD